VFGTICSEKTFPLQLCVQCWPQHPRKIDAAATAQASYGTSERNNMFAAGREPAALRIAERLLILHSGDTGNSWHKQLAH